MSKENAKILSGESGVKKVNEVGKAKEGRGKVGELRRIKEEKKKMSGVGKMKKGRKTNGDKGVKGVNKTGKDKRFWKNEQAIQRAFFRAKRAIGAKLLARRAKVSRATLYRHHKNGYQIMPDIEQETLNVFEQQMSEVKLKKGVKVQWLFYRMLSYIRKNRTKFRVMVQRGDERILEQMVDDLMPKIVQNYHISMENEEMVRVYQKEITGVVETWILDGFEKSEMSILKDIMYLTRTARKHLMMIGR